MFKSFTALAFAISGVTAFGAGGASSSNGDKCAKLVDKCNNAVDEGYWADESKVLECYTADSTFTFNYDSGAQTTKWDGLQQWYQIYPDMTWTSKLTQPLPDGTVFNIGVPKGTSQITGAQLNGSCAGHSVCNDDATKITKVNFWCDFSGSLKNGTGNCDAIP
jgi:hypothetical protein